jgi:3-phosphoshikimate 1-carboxyvinyltransferase
VQQGRERTAPGEPLWRPPAADTPVRGTITLPGSKSMTNRALLLAATAGDRSRLTGPLRSRDTALMAAALAALGVVVTDDGEDWLVAGHPPPLRPPGADRAVPIDVGNAGTVARFLPPLATLALADVTLDGDPRVRERPLGPLLTALRALGAELSPPAADALPVTVHGAGALPGGRASIDASSSSQHVSGLLLSAPHFRDGLDLRHVGGRLPSAPQLAMTLAMLETFGAHVEAGGQRWRVRPGRLQPCTVPVERDLSSAAPFLAAALVTGGAVTVRGWPAGSHQPGAALPELLAGMGAVVARRDGALTVRGTGRITGLTADLGDVSELSPVLAALAALADSPSSFRGIAHQRGQETDRLAALAGEIGGLGGDVREAADGLEVRPRPLHAGLFRCHDDHRLVMAAAVLGLAVPGLSVGGAGTVAKTLPDFVDRWERLVAPAGRTVAGAAR